MKKELDEMLCKKFPVLYAQRNLPMDQTCMCWGFDVGDGWYPLIDTLSDVLDNIVQNAKDNHIYQYKRDSNNPDGPIPDSVQKEVDAICVQAVQVKEKFGGLRFYVHIEGLPLEEAGEVHGAIAMAESMSYHICEDCGNPGKARSNGWITTKCDLCYAKRLA